MKRECHIFEPQQNIVRTLSKTFQNIGIWEAARHHEVVEAYVRHFSVIAEKINLYTTIFQWEHAASWRNHPAIEWHIKEDDGTWQNYFTARKSSLHSCDMLIATTLPEKFEDFTDLKFPCPAWLLIHNARYWFGTSPLRFYLGNAVLKDFAKIFRYTLLQKGKKRIHQLNPFENIIFPTEKIKAFSVSNFKMEKYSPAVIPFWFQRKVTRPIIPGQFTIIVPGSVSLDIRNYAMFEQILPEVLSGSPLKIRLVFLGKLRDNTALKWVRRIESIQSPAFEFQYFLDYVPQALYEKTILEADVILAPLHKTTRYDAVAEDFGFTTESGNIADIISYRIPGIIPDFYPVPEEFRHLFDTYKDVKDLTEILQQKIRLKSEGKPTEQTDMVSLFLSRSIPEQIQEQWHDFRIKYPLGSDD